MFIIKGSPQVAPQNDTAEQTDTDLTFHLDANQQAVFDFEVFWGRVGSVGIQVGLDGPDGISGRYGIGGTAFGNKIQSGTPGYLALKGEVTNGPNAGDVTLVFNNLTAVANAGVIVQAESYVTYEIQ